jgi:hypothetical protein
MFKKMRRDTHFVTNEIVNDGIANGIVKIVGYRSFFKRNREKEVNGKVVTRQSLLLVDTMIGEKAHLI